MMGVDHLVLNYGVKPPRFECLRCREFQVVVLPMEVSAAVRKAQEFSDQHIHCETTELDIGGEG